MYAGTEPIVVGSVFKNLVTVALGRFDTFCIMDLSVRENVMCSFYSLFK